MLYKKQKYKIKKISINGKRFDAFVADNFTKRMIGLMFRKSIAKTQCMLFVSGIEGKNSIWMYNMKFPIDVIWLDGKCRIVDIKENLKPCTSVFNCKEYTPKRESKYIIELNANAVKSNKISINSKIRL